LLVNLLAATLAPFARPLLAGLLRARRGAFPPFAGPLLAGLLRSGRGAFPFLCSGAVRVVVALTFLGGKGAAGQRNQSPRK
jgi:hypothetical protein